MTARPYSGQRTVSDIFRDALEEAGLAIVSTNGWETWFEVRVDGNYVQVTVDQVEEN